MSECFPASQQTCEMTSGVDSWARKAFDLQIDGKLQRGEEAPFGWPVTLGKKGNLDAEYHPLLNLLKLLNQRCHRLVPEIGQSPLPKWSALLREGRPTLPPVLQRPPLLRPQRLRVRESGHTPP